MSNENPSILNQLKGMDTQPGIKEEERIEIPKTEEEKIEAIHGELDVLHDRKAKLDSGLITPEDLDNDPEVPEYLANWLKFLMTLPEPKEWEPRISAFATDDFEYETFVAGACYNANLSLRDIARHLKITLDEFNFRREHPRYLAVVRARIRKIGLEGLIDRSDRWSDIAKAFSGYYRVKIKYIREYLNEIDPSILDKNLRPSNTPIPFPGEGVETMEGRDKVWHYDTIDQMLNVEKINQLVVKKLQKRFPLGQKASAPGKDFEGKRRHGKVVGYRVYYQEPCPILEFEDGSRQWFWYGSLYQLKG